MLNDLSEGRKAEFIRMREQLYRRTLQIDREISELRQQLVSPDRKVAALFRTLADNAQRAREILINNANEAIGVVEEFDKILYVEGLIQACNSEDAISAKVRNNTIEVIIDMDKVAGTLDNYANAVRLARKSLGTNTNSDPNSASIYWSDIYKAAHGERVIHHVFDKKTQEYKEKDLTEKFLGKYETTIALRASRYLAGKPAPWWRLLENGNAEVSLKSNRGGFPYPVHAPTNFVFRSKLQIQELLQSVFQGYLSRELEPFQIRLENLRKEKKQIEEERAQLTQATQGKTRKEIALEKIRTRLREKYEVADIKKIESLIDRLAAGERIEEKITVGRNTRIRVIQILNELNLEYKDLED